MSKRVKLVIAAAAVLVALIIALVVMTNLPENSEKNPSGASSSITQSEETNALGYLKVFAFKDEQVRDITVQNEKGGFALKYVKEDTWELDGAEKFTLNSEYVDNIIECCTEISATKLVAENPKDLSVYKISEDGVVANVKYSTGEKLTFMIGTQNSSGYYYVYLKQNDKVYLVDSSWANPFVLKYSSYLDLTVSDAIPVDEDGNDIEPYVQKLSFTGRGLENPIILIQNPDYLSYQQKVEAGEDDESKVAPAQYRFESPMKIEASDDSFYGIQNDFYGILALDIYSLKPTVADKEKCGLTNPYVTVSVENSKKTLKIMLGNELEFEGEKCYYAMSNERQSIFIVNQSDFYFFKDDLVNYMSSIVVNVVIDEIDTLTFENAGKKYVFETSGDGDDLVVRLNGKKLSTAEYRDLYQLVMLAYCEKSVKPGQYKGNAELKITYTYRDREKVDVIEYVKAETRRYLIRLNGSDLALCRSQYVDTLVFGLNEFIAGRDVPSDY